MRFITACTVLALTCSSAAATITAFWMPRTISAIAIANDPTGVLATSQCWSLMATNTDGHWVSAGVRATLPPGHTFYQTAPVRGGSDTHPNPAPLSNFPDLEFDTYVSSPRNQVGLNPPSLLGSYPDNPPLSFGGPLDPIPGTFAVSWGDPMATAGPGAGTYEIARFTWPQGVYPTVLPSSVTSQVLPDGSFNLVAIPEPSALSVVAVGVLALRRRRSA